MKRNAVIVSVLSSFFLTNADIGFGWSNLFALVDQEIAISTEVPPEQFTINAHSPPGRVSFHIQLSNEPISARLCIYTIRGECVRSIAIPAGGSYGFIWDGTDERSRNVASGIYHAGLTAGDNTVGKKFLFVRQ
jgi:flagellar hook assembly protein FlgD